MLYMYLQAEGSGLIQLLPILGLFVVMFFFFIRPQMKRQKEEKNFQKEIKPGARVVTASGMHGKISQVNDNTVVLETGAGKLTFEKTAISRENTLARFPNKTDAKK